MASLVDTTVLVYRFDPRDPLKQQIARDLLRNGQREDALLLPHQAVVEFIAAVTRPQRDLDGAPLMPMDQALLEAEDLMAQFPVIYPDANVLRTALRGLAPIACPGSTRTCGHTPRYMASRRYSRKISNMGATTGACA